MSWWTLRRLGSKDSRTRLAAVGKLGTAKDLGSLQALIGARCFDPDEEVREAALGALVARRRPSESEELLRLLGDFQPFRRVTAAEVLGRWKETRAFEPVVALLQDSSEGTREIALEALGHLGDARAVPHLIRSLADPAPPVRRAAGAALERIDPAWSRSEAVRQLLEDSRLKHEERTDALAALGKPAVEPLLEYLGRCHRERSWGPEAESAVAALRRIGDERAVDAFISTLDANLSIVAIAAADALAQAGDARAVTPLVGALRSPMSTVREAAARALHALGWVPSDDAERALRDVAMGNYQDAARHGAAAVPALWTEIHNNAFAIEALGETGHPSAVAPLVEGLKQKALRSEARQALRKLGNLAVDPLIDVLRSAESDVWWNEWFGDMPDVVSLRAEIAFVLGDLGDERATAPLIELLEDASPVTRAAAASALGQLGSVNARVPLEALREDPEEWVRSAAANAVARIEDGRSSP
jgi:HEAT repeat protein